MLRSIFCSTLTAGGFESAAMSTEAALKNFEKKGFKTLHFRTKDEFSAYLRREFSGTTVGFGGSVTLQQLGAYETLSENNKVAWHWKTDNPAAAIREAAEAKVYFLSANALTETGEIVNIDGKGNRVSASIFAPDREKVVFVCGTNKFAENLEKAVWRAKNIAAPMNSRRLNLKTPCAAKADKCYSCQSPQRICRVTSITTNPPSGCETYIAIVEGNWGY